MVKVKRDMRKNLKLFLFFTLLINIFFIHQSFAQELTVSGIITDKNDGTPMIGVTVKINNTTNGTISDANGKYSIKISNPNDTLVFSFISYNTLIIPVNGQSQLNAVMSSSVTQLSGMVVTALGIEREKKSLGYSVTEVKGDMLQTAKDVSMINQLSGKVAGLDVASANGGAASSSKIVLRGNKSFTNNNQALIVVDGVPIDNSTVSNAGDKWGGRDYGSGISDINPDDIESISVLKGASASALYGSRAANGVILITTKKGKASKKIQISFNSNTSFDTPYILWDIQNTYGAGRNGKFEGPWIINSNGIPVFDATNASSYGSWGPKMEGQEIIDWDGKQKSFSSQPDNYKDYFQTGMTLNNSVSLSGGKKNSTCRLTLADLKNTDIVPNVSVKRTNISLNAGTKIHKRVTLNVFGSYVRQAYDNRLGLSDAHNNANRNYIMMPRNVSNESLENNLMNTDGKEQTWYMNWAWMTNPFWNEEYELNNDTKNRFFGNTSLTIDLDTNLSLIIRTAPDHSLQKFWSRDAYNGLISSLGSYSEKEIQCDEYNTDFLLSYKKEWEIFSFTANAGGNAMYDKSKQNTAETKGGLNEPYIYTIENSLNTPKYRSLLYEKAINSLYFSGQLAYHNFLFLDVTARNDWSSTLPKGNNSYFYPSFSSGFVFSDLMNLSKKAEKIFSYGKIRASWAAVGNDTDPYRLNKTYYVDSTDTYGTIANVTTVIPPENLKPEKLVSKEIGTDMRFFFDRIGLDFSYYKTNSFNQIVQIDVSPASGSNYALINAGNIENKGIELQLNGKPVDENNFSWNFILNYTKNKSEVIELAEGVDNLQLMEHWGLSIEARPGHPYGDIVGYAIKRDANGNKLINENGMYLRSDTTQVLGNINPKFKLSMTNSFTWKNFTLSFLIDARIGGEMFAGTDMYGYGYAGNFSETLEGRDAWYASEEAREAAGISVDDWKATGGYMADGVYQTGTILLNGENNPESISEHPGYYTSGGYVYDQSHNVVGTDLSGISNQTFVNPEKYWSQFSDWTNEIHEPFVYDASYVKLRELTFTYKLPDKWFNKIQMKNFYVSVYGRNLWLMYSKVPNVDPETFHDSSSGQGYELYSYPVRRSIGFNLKFDF